MKPTTQSVFRRVMRALLVCAGLAAFSLSAEDLTVIRGASAKIDVPEGIRKIVIGSEKVIDARPLEDGRSALVVGLAEGDSELRIERLQGADLVYKVAVRSDLQAMVAQIKELLSDVVGLRIKTVGDKIVFEGRIMAQADWEKIKKVEASYGGGIMDLSTFGQPEMAEAVKMVILKDLADIGVDTATVQVNGDTVILDGVVYSDADLQRAVEKARLRMPNVRSLLRVEEIMIETDVQFVAVSVQGSSSFGNNNLLQSLGVSGNSGFSGGSSGKPQLSYGVAATTGTVGINAVLGSVNANNRVEESLTTKSGVEAHFLGGGGTSYLPVSGNVGGSFQQVDFGMFLGVKPVLQGKDRIVTEVTVTLKAPPPPNTQPYTVTTLIDSKNTVICKSGESIVIAGLDQVLANASKTRTPGLGDIPVLNMFFSERDKSKNQTKLVAVVTPRLVFPSAGTGHPFNEERQKLLLNAAR